MQDAPPLSAVDTPLSKGGFLLAQETPPVSAGDTSLSTGIPGVSTLGPLSLEEARTHRLQQHFLVNAGDLLSVVPSYQLRMPLSLGHHLPVKEVPLNATCQYHSLSVGGAPSLSKGGTPSQCRRAFS